MAVLNCNLNKFSASDIGRDRADDPDYLSDENLEVAVELSSKAGVPASFVLKRKLDPLYGELVLFQCASQAPYLVNDYESSANWGVFEIGLDEDDQSAGGGVQKIVSTYKAKRPVITFYKCENIRNGSEEENGTWETLHFDAYEVEEVDEDGDVTVHRYHPELVEED